MFIINISSYTLRITSQWNVHYAVTVASVATVFHSFFSFSNSLSGISLMALTMFAPLSEMINCTISVGIPHWARQFFTGCYVAMHNPVLAMIRLSIRLSVTRWHCVKTKQARITKSSLIDRPRTVFGIKNSSRNLKGFPPSEGIKWEWGRKNSDNKSLYLRNGAR